MKTQVSKDLCIGCELCPSLEPSLYRMDDDGLAVAVKNSTLSDEEAEKAREAAESCPVDAISVE